MIEFLRSMMTMERKVMKCREVAIETFPSSISFIFLEVVFQEHQKKSKTKEERQKGNAGNRTQNLLFTRQTQYHYATPPDHIFLLL